MNRFKHLHGLLTIVALTGLFATLTGCRTSEKNYRAAYEVAREKFDNEGGLDSTIYNRFRPQGRGSAMVVGSDTLRIHTIAIGTPEGGGATRESIGRYCVVVAQFKQIFNAKSMRARLEKSGYAGAAVVSTREPLYYVVAGSAPTPEGALEIMRSVEADKGIVLRDPFPWVLQPAHKAR